QPALEQARVEAENRVGRLDVAAHADRHVVDADVRADRGSAACAAVAGEALHLAPFGEERGGEQVAGGLRALAAAPLNDDLQHDASSAGIAVDRRGFRCAGVRPSTTSVAGGCVLDLPQERALPRRCPRRDRESAPRATARAYHRREAARWESYDATGEH